MTLRAPAAPEDAVPDVPLAGRLFEELRRRTGTADGITRASYGPGEAIAHATIRREAEALGFAVAEDAALNLYVTLPGRERGPITVVGSHLDSVPLGGNFDGAAGLLMGLSVLAGFRRAGVRPRRDVTVMAIRAEESTWFNASYIGSRAALGLLSAEEVDTAVRSDNGRTLADCLSEAGGDPEALRRGDAFLDARSIGAFVEPHIEQGPCLVEGGLPVGIVTGIRGSFRHRGARCFGAYAHSGATPRAARQDAVSAVAALVTALNALWTDAAERGEDLAITVGQISTDPAEHAFSKVAGRVDFSLDVRSQSPDTLERVRAALGDLVAAAERDHRVSFALGPLTGTEPARMDEAIVASMSEASRASGLNAPLMACGAGHDAAVFAGAGVPTGMLFIRNEHGSHNPREAMALDDFAAAAAILSRFCFDPPERCP